MENWVVSLLLTSALSIGFDEPKDPSAKCHELLKIKQASAERYLKEITLQEDTKTIIAEKLHIKQLKLGDGTSEVKKGDTPHLVLEIYEIKPDGEELSWTIKEPKKINLEFCIEGIQKGVLGMTRGEKRRIFMHPFLMQGEYGPLRPYNFILYDVELISNEDDRETSENP